MVVPPRQMNYKKCNHNAIVTLHRTEVFAGEVKKKKKNYTESQLLSKLLLKTKHISTRPKQ